MGSHNGFKIRCCNKRTGSSPVRGTNLSAWRNVKTREEHERKASQASA